MTFSNLAPIEPTEVYETYWRFAAERQDIFFRRLAGKPRPWTDDLILGEYKFTNAYRASDRVSQYLIRYVLYEGEQSPPELFFRTVLFKTFNRIETWEALKRDLGGILYSDYDFGRYDQALCRIVREHGQLFSGAYIMPSGTRVFRHRLKHRNCLKLLERMMKDAVPERLCDAPSLMRAFELLRSYPLLGDFLAYQYAIDLNYSTMLDFSEMDFVVPGPGALSGIRKCFSRLGGLTPGEVIRVVAERQNEEFATRGIQFQALWGRPLQLIDCQNLFCEVDKYARLAHPNVPGLNDRTRLKRKFSPNPEPIDYWYPPKWGLNKAIGQARKQGG